MKSILQLLWGPPGLIFIGAMLAGIGALWASRQQTEFERHLRGKSDQIAELNREIANIVTGGDSFCYVTIASLDPKTNRGILTVVHQGGHPIYDVSARIVDLQLSCQIKDYSLPNLQKAETNLHIGNMTKETAVIISPFDLGSSSSRDFNIFFGARNGLFTQLLRLRKIDGKWTTAIKVDKDGKTVFEKINDDFPKTKQDQVQW